MKTYSDDDLRAVVSRYWGFSSFRPLQREAIDAVLAGRDSLVVMPTGGGKSLCYQVPALLGEETTVVVSPLISLMKDQVDGLLANGVAAVQINSSMPPDARSQAERRLLAGSIRLLFVAPERLMASGFIDLLRRVRLRAFAIDEAHCISQWGHDFRLDYRELGRLRGWFPDVGVHGYTATATERVRQDLVRQLRLRDPQILVGSFDRANLTYRVVPRADIVEQIIEVMSRHPQEAGIIYCVRRRDVDNLASVLRGRGYDAVPYHAGLAAQERKRIQDAFAAEKCNLMVATVAFGMGIDRSNVRFVVHAGMPKCLEAYHQETGRAGRDGLPAECVLLHSRSDLVVWKRIIEKAAGEQAGWPDYRATAVHQLEEMDRFCQPIVCRHRTLVQYFGQKYESPSCQACDVCLNQEEPHPQSQVLAQKILSCVARVGERFGATHVVNVLRGRTIASVTRLRHDRLSTFGLLDECSKEEIHAWIDQLLGQGVLQRTEDRYPVLRLCPRSWEVLRGKRTVRLARAVAASGSEGEAWQDVDRELFEALRDLCRQWADGRAVATSVIFADATLRSLARVRPSSLEQMRLVSGIGDAKLREFGTQLLCLIDRHCRDRSLTRNNPDRAASSGVRKASSPAQQTAAIYFRQGASVEEVMQRMGRARSTVIGYLREFVRAEHPVSVTPWVDEVVYQQVAAAARRVGTERLKPIYIALNQEVSYEIIALVVAHLSRGGS